MRARAAVLTQFGVPLTLSEIEVAAPRQGEVMVAIAASGICGSDLKALDGGNPRVQELPFILGHESAGVVTEVGPGVTSVCPGDHVVIAMNRPCGRCRNCVPGTGVPVFGPGTPERDHGADGGRNHSSHDRGRAGPADDWYRLFR